jgi:16S rRNA (guanine(966)-N(2))-methyltransferase RsmD
VGIEQSARACAIIRQNWQKVATEEQTFQVIKGDVGRQLKTLAGQQFDRIYFDPPYASELYEPVLGAIAQFALLTPDGELAVEHSPGRAAISTPACFSISRQKDYGNTALTFYRFQHDGSSNI